MNTHDKIELPPLPSPTHRGYGLHYNADEMESYAIAAIEADRKRISASLDRRHEEAMKMSITSREGYYDGLADGYDIADRIVKGEIA